MGIPKIFRNRWGGWYVSGSHGDMRHMGNTYLRGGQLDTTSNGNLETVGDLIDSDTYLSPYSDIRALMVLEHQTQVHNAFTRADFIVRTELNNAGHVADAEWDLRLQAIAKPVVDRLLFCDEFPLTAPVQGNPQFTRDFQQRGPQDGQGRSLRQFDMQTRMFKYPLSYLIYSDAFAALQPQLKQEIVRQLGEVLGGRAQSSDYEHLSQDDRANIQAILRDTMPAVSSATIAAD